MGVVCRALCKKGKSSMKCVMLCVVCSCANSLSLEMLDVMKLVLHMLDVCVLGLCKCIVLLGKKGCSVCSMYVGL